MFRRNVPKWKSLLWYVSYQCKHGLDLKIALSNMGYKYIGSKENKMLQINEYQKKAHETADYPSGTIGIDRHTVDYLYPAFGLSEEAGEVAGKFAKAVRDNQGVIDVERKIAIVKELGDVCWFIAELCTVLNVNMEDVMQKNLDKLASRKARGVIHGSGDDR